MTLPDIYVAAGADAGSANSLSLRATGDQTGRRRRRGRSARRCTSPPNSALPSPPETSSRRERPVAPACRRPVPSPATAPPARHALARTREPDCRAFAPAASPPRRSQAPLQDVVGACRCLAARPLTRRMSALVLSPRRHRWGFEGSAGGSPPGSRRGRPVRPRAWRPA